MEPKFKIPPLKESQCKAISKKGPRPERFHGVDVGNHLVIDVKCESQEHLPREMKDEEKVSGATKNETSSQLSPDNTRSGCSSNQRPVMSQQTPHEPTEEDLYKSDGNELHKRQCLYPRNDCGNPSPQGSKLTEQLLDQTREKRFSCLHCPKEFSLLSKLIRHERMHTGQKPFNCKYCQKQFSQRSHVVEHERIHTGDKRYQCSHCPKKFIRNTHRITHERIHTGEKPFGCTHCDKKFSDKLSLISHVRVHTGEQPYHCSHCSRKFSQRSNLTTHERNHAGHKPFHCTHCPKKFARKLHLTRHEGTHTGGKL